MDDDDPRLLPPKDTFHLSELDNASPLAPEANFSAQTTYGNDHHDGSDDETEEALLGGLDHTTWGQDSHQLNGRLLPSQMGVEDGTQWAFAKALITEVSFVSKCTVRHCLLTFNRI